MSEILPPDHFHPEELMDALVARGVCFILIGGLAVGVHGVVRATRDMDIVPAPDSANLTRLAAVLWSRTREGSYAASARRRSGRAARRAARSSASCTCRPPGSPAARAPRSRRSEAILDAARSAADTGREMSHDYVGDAHRAFDAFNRRDLDAFLDFLDPAVQFQSLVVGMEGDYHGHEGIRRYWRDVLAASPDFTAEVVDVRDLGDGTLTKLVARGHGAGSDVPYEQTLWSVSRGRGGAKAVWIANFATEAEALEAAGLRA
jgi:SnoaL-like domain